MGSVKVIVVEGAHGSSKSTLARALASALLADHPHAVVAFHHTSEGHVTPWEAAGNYLAQRARVLRVESACGTRVLVADRWFWSTAVLGAALGGPAGMRLARLAALEREEHGDPALTIVCDAPEDVLAARLAARGETWGERERMEHHEILRLARLRSWPVLDTTRPRDVVLADALGIVREVLHG